MPSSHSKINWQLLSGGDRDRESVDEGLEQSCRGFGKIEIEWELGSVHVEAEKSCKGVGGCGWREGWGQFVGNWTR